MGRRSRVLFQQSFLSRHGSPFYYFFLYLVLHIEVMFLSLSGRVSRIRRGIKGQRRSVARKARDRTCLSRFARRDSYRFAPRLRDSSRALSHEGNNPTFGFFTLPITLIYPISYERVVRTCMYVIGCYSRDGEKNIRLHVYVSISRERERKRRRESEGCPLCVPVYVYT